MFFLIRLSCCQLCLCVVLVVLAGLNQCLMGLVFSVAFFSSCLTLVLWMASLFVLIYCANVFVDDLSSYVSILSGNRGSSACLM